MSKTLNIFFLYFLNLPIYFYIIYYYNAISLKLSKLYSLMLNKL